MISRAFLVKFLIGVCYLLRAADSTQVKLPKGFVQCKRKDPNFNKCVLDATQLSVPELAKGQPKFNIPTIDPIRLDSLYVDKGQGSVVAKINFTNMDIGGLKTSVIENVRVDFQNSNIRVVLRTKQPLSLNGLYNIAGKIMVLPIVGNGPCKFVMDDFRVNATLKFKSQQKNNEQYWHLEKVDFDFETKKLRINLENLFKGNKELGFFLPEKVSSGEKFSGFRLSGEWIQKNVLEGDNMNKFMNENWELLLDELRYAFVDALSAVFGEYVRRFFDRVPITQVFPLQ